MTFLAAVAAGPRAAEDLRVRSGSGGAQAGTSFRRHGDLAVAWATGCPWIDSHDDGQVLVVLDGRLHNVGPSPASPAELLLARYRACGQALAEGLLGDFVLVVLDRARSTLLVARDPVGVRPWYQAAAGGDHAGASDLGTLATLPWVDTTVNEPVAVEYLAAGCESRGETLYRGITTLGPGTTWCTHAGRSRTFAHHRWDVEPELGVSFDDAAHRCRSLLEEAVRCRLRDGGPATSELSGGLDSSSVVGTAVLLGHDDLAVARLLFEGPRADERAFSDAVIEHWGITAFSCPPWIPTEEESEALVREMRRPPPDPNFTMFSSLHRVLLEAGRADGLTGLGGDDAFESCRPGGRVVSAVKLRQGAVLRGLVRSGLRDPGRAWRGLLRPTLRHIAPWPSRAVASWVSEPAARRTGLARVLRRAPARLTGIDSIDERLANLSSGYDASILEDRAVMADRSGWRDSHPFLDPRFIEGTYGLDPWWPTRGGGTRALQVEAYRDRLPAMVAGRRSKADFSEVFWPQVLDDARLAKVRTGPLTDHGWLNPDGFDALVARGREGRANAAIPLARCLSLDRWARLH